MSDQSPLFAGVATSDEHEADLRAREDDPTPRGVARAVLEAWAAWILELPGEGIEGSGLRVLDVCAGYGCWASEIRRLAGAKGWPVHVTGVEIDERKREHLRKWCERYVVGVDARAWLDREVGRRAAPDFVIGNPAFSLLAPSVPQRAGEADVEAAAARSLVSLALRVAPAVLLLHTQQAFLRGRVGRAVIRRHPPAASWQIPGAVSFRSDGKTDSRCYQATLWMREHAGPCATYLLPELGREALRWRVLPGVPRG